MLQTDLWLVENGEAEICQFQVQLARLVAIFRRYQDVLRLDVPVSDVLQVHVVEGEEYLLNHVSSLALAQSLHLDDVVVELATWNQLRHNIEVHIILEEL